MYELPTEIEIAGRPYHIRNRGDYRMILDVFSVLEDPELDGSERIISALIIFYEDLNEVEDVLALPDMEEAVKKMYDFFNAGKPENNSGPKRKLVDWEGDTAIIVSAINNVAGFEVRAVDYMHWWTFLSYYMSIGECILSTVVGIRDKIVRGKSLEKWEREYKRDNPQYFIWNSRTVEDIEAEEWVKSVWNKE